MSSIDAIVRHRYAQLADVRLHYVEAGPNDPDAPAVVLLHGFPDFWYSWRHQIESLAAAGFRVCAPDLRGYNLSDKPRGTPAYKMEVLVQDVVDLIAERRLVRPILVGHDWGGVVAWWVAMRAPDRIGRLGIVNAPHPGHLVSMFTSPAQLRRSWYIFFFQLPWLPERRLRSHAFAGLRSMLERGGAARGEELDRYVEAYGLGSFTAQLNYYRALVPSIPFAQRHLRPIELPVRVFWGARDHALSREFATPPTTWVWDVHVEMFDEGGHWVHAERPDLVNPRLLEFAGAPLGPCTQPEGGATLKS